MQLPTFKGEQPGPLYYYSPITVLNIGMVDHAHAYPDVEVGAHMYTHVYHKDTGKKGSNSVASLIMKTLHHMNLLREDKMGRELTIVFDNFQGQNKNNTFIKMMTFIAETGYFKKVNAIFLVVGHTKNSADSHFNCLKLTYHKTDCFLMEDLLPILDVSDKVTVLETIEDDFKDWDAYLSHFYRDFVNKVQRNHIFRSGRRVGNEVLVKI